MLLNYIIMYYIIKRDINKAAVLHQRIALFRICKTLLRRFIDILDTATVKRAK